MGKPKLADESQRASRGCRNPENKIMDKKWTKIKPWTRSAQAQAPTPLAQPAPPAQQGAPISAQPQPAPQKVNAPHTLTNCKVTVDGHNLIIESPETPPISLSLSGEQQNAVGARLKQKRPVPQQPAAPQTSTVPIADDPVMQA